MMTEQQAKRIGSTQAIKAVFIGCIVAQLIMMFFSSEESFVKSFLWFTTVNYKMNILVGVLIMFLFGHIFGEWAGKAIIRKKQDETMIGILCSIFVLLSTSLLSGITGFLSEGIENVGTEDNPFIDYLVKPFFWIMIFGILPAVLVGIWFGRRVKKKSENT
jgi:hypothetical protein